MAAPTAQTTASATLPPPSDTAPALLLFIDHDGEDARCFTIDPEATLEQLFSELGIDPDAERLVVKGCLNVPSSSDVRVADLLTPGASLEVLGHLLGGGKRGRAPKDDAEDGGKKGGRSRSKYKVHTMVTGLGRVHLGPGVDANTRLREVLRDVLETYLTMGRVLQDRVAAALHVWLAQLWTHDFRGFHAPCFSDTFWIKDHATAFGKAMLASTCKSVVLTEDSSITTSSFMPKEFQEAMRIVLGLDQAEAVAGALLATVNNNPRLREFLARLAPGATPFEPGMTLMPLGVQIGTALRNQWSARKLNQAWRNYLLLAAEDAIGASFLAIPVKV